MIFCAIRVLKFSYGVYVCYEFLSKIVFQFSGWSVINEGPA